MEVLMNIWLAFNIVFGLWSARNLVMKFYCLINCKRIRQSDTGKLIDMAVMVSILAYFFTV